MAIIFMFLYMGGPSCHFTACCIKKRLDLAFIYVYAILRLLYAIHAPFAYKDLNSALDVTNDNISLVNEFG